jgi:preprotein translocase subunit SecA
MPIESKMLTKIIESAQRKVEGRNFSIRKNVLNYDDVMNTQREIIYKQRAQVLDGEDIHDYILKMMKDLVEGAVDRYLLDDVNKSEWNFVGLKDYFLGWLTTEDDLKYDEKELEKISKEQIVKELLDKITDAYNKKEEEIGSSVLRELERVILLKVVDTKWMAHIDDMEELKKGIGLRAYGQHNPVVEYRYEGFEMFDAMIESIREDTVRLLLTVKVNVNAPIQREQVAKPETPTGGDGSFVHRRVANNKLKDNDLCSCGSGKKYKKCCGMKN